MLAALFPWLPESGWGRIDDTCDFFLESHRECIAPGGFFDSRARISFIHAVGLLRQVRLQSVKIDCSSAQSAGAVNRFLLQTAGYRG
jgi:hypothetical protein